MSAQVRAGYKQTEVRVIPEDWNVTPLGNWVRITSGESPSLIQFTDSGKPYFKVEQLSNCEKYLGNDSSPYHFINGKTVLRNSVIFAKRGAAIALNRVRILSENSFMDTNLMALTCLGDLDHELMKGAGKAACILPHGVLFRGNAEATIRQQLVRSGKGKATQDDLDKKIDATYPKITEAEIKTLVVDNKWMAHLSAAVQSELARVSQSLTGRIRELAERYATPLPRLTDEVATLAAKVAEHLKKMGVRP